MLAGKIAGLRIFPDESVTAGLRGLGLTVETGIFGAAMEVELVNVGPLTILLDTKQAF